MPLVSIALAAYVSGLLAGFAASVPLAIVAIVAAAAVGRTRHAAVAAGLAALVIAGGIVATNSRTSTARCAYAAAHASQLLLVLSDSAEPGSFSHGQLVDCGVAVTLSVDRGSAPSGSTVLAAGDVVRTQRGVMLQHGTVAVAVTAASHASMFARAKARSGAAIDRTFGSDAPLVRALLIADRTELSPEVRDNFAVAGLAHILAIAGLHIGIVAGALALLLEVCGISRQRAALITLAVIIAYVVIIGAPVPAVRSATMLAALHVSRLIQRPTSRWAVVALGASQPVFAPDVVVAVGYQLSVVGVAAMIAAGMLARRIGVHRRPAIVKAVLLTLLGTTVATIATAPIVAWVFGRVSTLAPLSNLAAAPLIALAQPMIFFGLVLSPLRPVAAFFADAAHPLLVGLTTVASVTASIPHASITIAPTLPMAVVAGAMSLSVIVACASQDWRLPAGVASAAAGALIWMPLTPSGTGMMELHMIDVGQGDAIALRTPHGHWLLFDAGPAWPGGDAGRSTVLPYLGRRGGSLDAFVLSHPHTDHVGGAATVIRALRPRAYIDAGFPGGAGAYRASLAAARDERVPWRRAHPGDTLTDDGVLVTLLAPDSVWTSSLTDPNLASLVALVRFGDVRMLLMGDAERAEEEWLLARWPDLHADVLKVGHHGSGTSTSARFLGAVRPRAALVSVAGGNRYHLPTPGVMHTLAAQGAQVLRTDQVGSIVARTDGRRIFVDAAGDSWELSRSSPLLRPP
jgi:competence protein ComEC